jgi:hypothetical protein
VAGRWNYEKQMNQKRLENQEVIDPKTNMKR